MGGDTQSRWLPEVGGGGVVRGGFTSGGGAGRALSVLVVHAVVVPAVAALGGLVGAGGAAVALAGAGGVVVGLGGISTCRGGKRRHQGGVTEPLRWGWVGRGGHPWGKRCVLTLLTLVGGATATPRATIATAVGAGVVGGTARVVVAAAAAAAVTWAGGGV